MVIAPLASEGDKHLIALWFGQDPVPVIATDNHPYWVEGVGWVQAGSLQPGDVTATSTGTTLVLQDVADLGWFADQTVYNLHASGTHTYFVTATPDQPDQLVHNASACNIGGVYALVSDSGRVVRTGRTNDLWRRQLEHARDFPDLVFRPLYRTNNRLVQRGLEQVVHSRYRPILNRVNPIGARNRNGPSYMRAAAVYLRGGR